MNSTDQEIRLAAFNWIKKITEIQGDVLSREILQYGFPFKNERIPLVSPQGIFKPKHMQFPLSITTAPKSPYSDSPGEGDALWLYKYRGNNINHSDNTGLRNAMENKIPMIFLLGIVPGKYMITWPVYIIEDRQKELTFVVRFGEFDTVFAESENWNESNIRRLYSTTIVRARLHQRSFRERVLYAYKNQCSLCRLKHQELLDAAHIIGDKEELGEPVIKNGIALCKLHHAAFDKYLIGINNDYHIKVREDILAEIDGPMLQHGLKNLNDKKIILPTHKENWPDKALLDLRYQKFLSVY